MLLSEISIEKIDFNEKNNSSIVFILPSTHYYTLLLAEGTFFVDDIEYNYIIDTSDDKYIKLICNKKLPPDSGELIVKLKSKA